MNENQKKPGINWLHLSDLYFGVVDQTWMWPTLKRKFLDDLTSQFSLSGDWHVVIFSGDLTQRGSADNYSQLTDAFEEIWDRFRELGCDPFLFPCVGNHYLLRPHNLESRAKVLKQWWEDSDIRENFWSEAGNEYRGLISEVFLNYSDWLKNLSNSSIRLPEIKNGIFPGDMSAVIEGNGQNLGIVGLNSSWLQLDGSDYQGKLLIHPRQLMSVTSNDPDKWCDNHHHNLIVTHHPENWLHPDGCQLWNREINVIGRFDAHLFGHMHEANISSFSESGAPEKRVFQASSLFGLEKFNENQNRIHGYSAGTIYSKDEIKNISVWPRRIHMRPNGTMAFIQDPDLDLNNKGAIHYSYNLRLPSAAYSAELISNSKLLINTQEAYRVLNSIRRISSFSKANVGVRNGEQALCTAALKESRVVWLTSDWGLGSDEFIRVIQENLGIGGCSTYQIDLNGYKSRDAIFSGVQEELGCSFEKLCEALSHDSDNTLILDDVTINDNDSGSTEILCADISKIIDAILDYCPKTRVVVRSRHVPPTTNLTVIELRPLDEADTKAYISDHDLGGKGLSDPDSVAKIYRHTDGIPYRIDSILRDIEIVGIDNLHSLDSDVAGKLAVVGPTPPALIEAINELENSNDPAHKRAYLLLKVLTVFPQGEELPRIRRFLGATGFFDTHARLLLRNAFVDAVTIPDVGDRNKKEAKALLVRRPVREYMYRRISTTELNKINRQALVFYFGTDWGVRGIKAQTARHFDNPKCGAWEIGNAGTLILRALRQAIESGKKEKIIEIIKLAGAFCADLMKGNHYRSVVSLGDDIKSELRHLQYETPEMMIFSVLYGRALRMSGQQERARDHLKSLDLKKLAKGDAESVLLNLALCYETLGEADSAVATAKECETRSPRTQRGLHAKSIVVSLSDNYAERDKKLREIELKARKLNYHNVANNVAFRRAEHCGKPEMSKDILQGAMESAFKNGDHYTGVRALVFVADWQLKEGLVMSESEELRLISAYQYLFGERLDVLFNKCHAVLWELFEKTGNTSNLIKLFRHSSFFWRLRGQDNQESQYLKRLADFLTRKIQLARTVVSLELAYFIARTGNAIGDQKLTVHETH